MTSEAGITFQNGHQGKTPLNILETAGGGAAFLDYDGDGKLDILLVGKRVALYHNEGGGKFRDVSAESGLTVTGDLMGCAVGDYDNDGKPDIFITGHGVAKLYHNRDGKGHFEEVTAKAGVGPHSPQSWATSAGFADLDGDGFLDLVVCHYVEFGPKTRQLCDFNGAKGEKVFAACPPLYYERQSVQVYRNRGNGTFEEKTSLLPKGHGANLGLAFADFNDDGRMDFYVANDAQPGDLYRNDGHWKFTNVGTESTTAYTQDGQEQAGMGADWGDFDGDGRLDLIVSTFDNEAKSLYRNAGEGLFAYSSYQAGIGNASKSRLSFGVSFLDIRNTGFPDLLFANGHVQDTIGQIRPPATFAQPMQLFLNKGDGTFAEATAEGGAALLKPIVGRALAVGDYDNDGKLDVLVANAEGTPLLLHNESREPNHWLGVQLVSRQGHGTTLGARVTLAMGAGKRVAESQTCRSYLSASDSRVHFGLGKTASISRLTVRWSNGKTLLVENPPVDSYLRLEEK